ncbi:hypothetical protein J7E90_23965 [Streptomyces sp. ISL-111]|nr:hypothetical protein [Streptomyces sp. ISL-111]MBT2429474.1 hypothetical protein [Streptomyces sp. ISL-112]MBT2463389.1 hypothetical protein [Streptomyces sp. ISL-63]
MRRDGGRTFTTLEELEQTETDPVAACEAGMLTHLVDGHSELVPLLLRQLPFPKPVTDIDQAGPQIHALLAAARRVPQLPASLGALPA